MTTTPNPTPDVAKLLGAAIGTQIPGGCGDCDAYQTMRRDRLGIFHLTVHHDDTCPAYRAMTGGTR